MNAKEIIAFLLNAGLDEPESPITDMFSRDNAIYLRTTDNKVFKLTVEEDSIVNPDDFDKD